jgi:hypothetical protein
MMLIEKYKALINEIQTNVNIRIEEEFTQIELANPSSRFLERRREVIQEEAGIIMDDSDLVLFQLTGISLLWEGTLKNVDLVLTGGFEFNGFTDALTFYSDFWKGAFSLAPDVEVPENLQHFEQLGWFSRQAWDDGRYGCFIKQPGNFPPPIAFYSRGWYVKLDMTFEEYLENMFNMYGAKGWQFFFIEPSTDMTDKEDILTDMRVISEQFPFLFPEKDWTFLTEKYELYKQKFEVKTLI